MLDTSNKFRHLIDLMDAAKGSSVPFVRKYLDDIKGLRTENPRQSDMPLMQVCRCVQNAARRGFKHVASSIPAV